MSPKPKIYRQRIPSTDPRLGRHVIHDERSRGFALPVSIDRSTWRTKSIRLYDPSPNPNQIIGNCTGCAKAMMFNSVGNRVAGRVLTMADADKIYSLATTIDPWPGSYPPDDTGSSGLAAAKAAQRLKIGGEYRWLFGGADEIVQAVMDGHVVNVGTNWYESMFTNRYADGVPLTISGAVAGGHEWQVHGYNLTHDLVKGRCWWGSFRDFWIKRADLDRLMHESGDAHVQALPV